MWALRAGLLGAAAATGLAYVLGAAAAVLASTAGLDLRIALGPVVLVGVDADAGATTTTFGSGLLAIGLVGAVVNVVAAVAIRRGRARRRDRDSFA